MVDEWSPKLKTYSHFDEILPVSAIYNLVKNPKRVAKNPFFPFLSFKIRSRKFGNPKVKVRSIKYACRKDSYIYSYYRHILSKEYEREIENRGIKESVIAYRKIPKEYPNSDRGKSNIEFAKEAFDEIRRRGDCYAIAVDISGFFESIDHENLKIYWQNLLGVDRLPDDHFAVYKSLTDYRYVDYDECLKRLGLLSLVSRRGKLTKAYAYTKKAMPKRLCTPDEFREKIAGGGSPSLIERNPYLYPSSGSGRDPEARGIPQGSPLSDLLANIIMLGVDTAIAEHARKEGAYYRRYSDDILYIGRKDTDVNEVIGKIESELISMKWLKINKEKTKISRFEISGRSIFCQNFNHEMRPVGGAFEYLGFSFDGEKIFIRNSTLSKYYKKVSKIVLGHAMERREQALALGRKFTLKDINRSLLFHKASRVNINFNVSSPKKTTHSKRKPSNFHTYVSRSQSIMKSGYISSQIRRHRKFLNRAIRRAVTSLT